jgi:hypothetical protein
MENSIKKQIKSDKALLFEMMQKINGVSINESMLNEAKEEKWIQDTDMKKGTLHKKLGIPEDEKIPLEVINSKIKEIKDKYKKDEKMSSADRKFIEELNLAKTLKTKV